MGLEHARPRGPADPPGTHRHTGLRRCYRFCRTATHGRSSRSEDFDPSTGSSPPHSSPMHSCPVRVVGWALTVPLLTSTRGLSVIGGNTYRWAAARKRPGNLRGIVQLSRVVRAHPAPHSDTRSSTPAQESLRAAIHAAVKMRGRPAGSGLAAEKVDVRVRRSLRRSPENGPTQMG